MITHIDIRQRPSVVPVPVRGSDRVASQSRTCERMLRDVALVLHLTRTVKQSIQKDARWSNPDAE